MTKRKFVPIRRIKIVTVCEATVTEEWYFEVPETWTDEEIADLAELEGVYGFMDNEVTQFIDVVDTDTADERNREVVRIERLD